MWSTREDSNRASWVICESRLRPAERALNDYEGCTTVRFVTVMLIGYTFIAQASEEVAGLVPLFAFLVASFCSSLGLLSCLAPFTSSSALVGCRSQLKSGLESGDRKNGSSPYAYLW